MWGTYREMDPWAILDTYFRDHLYPFNKHHLDSFREFLRTHIPNTIRSYNPITMIKEDATGEETLRVEVYVGDKGGDKIFIERPTVLDADGKPMLLTPQEARLRDLTYAAHLFADVRIDYFKDGETQPISKVFPMTFIGSIPLMLHSEPCVLHAQGSKVLQGLGECSMDPGGYFIVDGKEKVIVSQERIATNRLFVKENDGDDEVSISGTINCTSATNLVPRTVTMQVLRKANPKEEIRKVEGAILVSLPSINGYIPLGVLFRALGVESDRQMVELICGPLEGDIPVQFQDFIRPSLVHAAGIANGKDRGVYNITDALEYMRKRTTYDSVIQVRSILSQDLFPHLPENLAIKAIYLGYLVGQVMRTKLGLMRPSDRDSYIFKRVDISGFLLAQLFQQGYGSFRKHIRDTLDYEYHYSPWKNIGGVEELVRQENLMRIFPPGIVTDLFHRSLKGNWGAEEDPEQGKVQDLGRISYIGFLSHLRRVNMPLDRSIKLTSPHRLHAQQWGIMCPFESPDGASIGYLKNFALMTQITFGTSVDNIRTCLDDLDVDRVENVSIPLLHDANAVRVFINGTLHGVTKRPNIVTRALRLFRRNGLLNPFVSIAWNIVEREIRILTEAGRPCRPLLILDEATHDLVYSRYQGRSKLSWYDLIFGSRVSEQDRNAKGYYKDSYKSPFAMMEFQNMQLEGILVELEKTQACIEYVDIEEENTRFVAMKSEEIQLRHTHLEIHPSTIFSVVTQIVPFANHNQAPRVIFHGAQSKQALGVYATNFHKRFDTMGYIQHYPQRRIVSTRGSHYNGNDRMPNGCNVIVAVATHTGFNQEDGIIINKSSVDRGLFHVTAYKTMVAKEKALNQRERLMFANPIHMRDGGKAVENIRHADWTLLDDRGFVKEESYVPRGQTAAIVGMVHVSTHVREKKVGVFTQHVIEETYQDASMVTDVHHYGKIDSVFVGQQTPGNPSRICKVRFRKIRKPELGDKHCLTPDHEVLTKSGWKPIAEVTKKDEVYVLKADGSFGYEKPIDLIVKDCKDVLLYDLHSQQVDLCVTQEHSMWVKPRNKTAYERIPAKDIIGKRVVYAKSALNPSTEDMNTARVQVEATFGPSGIYTTSSCEAADDVQKLALHAGYAANISLDGLLYRVRLVKDQDLQPEINSDANSPNDRLVSYSGKVYCFEVPSHVFYVRRNGKPVWIGNCSAHGQKGVVGMVIPQENMPFTKDGVVPDLIINPHAFPSRMTIGHLVETVMSKMCCLEGSYGDGTVFLPFDVNEVYDNLEKQGFDKHGNEILYNGRTGQQIETEIFIGPIYYYRLKHMVTDKIHARGTGPRVQLTHQPTSGRSKMGGLRIGEMERDVLLAHGLSQFAKECMMEKSDTYIWAACRHCGVLAKYAPRKGIQECMSCQSTDLAVINTPYAFKLLVQELEAIGVQMRISTETHEFEEYLGHDLEDILDDVEEPSSGNVATMDVQPLPPKPSAAAQEGGSSIIPDAEDLEDDILGGAEDEILSMEESEYDEEVAPIHDGETEEFDEDRETDPMAIHEQAFAPPSEPEIKVIDLSAKSGIQVGSGDFDDPDRDILWDDKDETMGIVDEEERGDKQLIDRNNATKENDDMILKDEITQKSLHEFPPVVQQYMNTKVGATR